MLEDNPFRDIDAEIDQLSAERVVLWQQKETLEMFGKVRESEDLDSRVKELSRQITDLLEESLERQVTRGYN